MAPAAGFRRNMGRFASCAIGISERWSFRRARQLDDALGRLDPNGVPAGVAAAVQTIRERKHARLLRALADGAVTTAVGARVSPTAASTRCTSSFPARAGRRECHRRRGPGRWPPTTRCRESSATAWQTGSAATRFPSSRSTSATRFSKARLSSRTLPSTRRSAAGNSESSSAGTTSTAVCAPHGRPGHAPATDPRRVLMRAVRVVIHCSRIRCRATQRLH